MSDPFDTLRNAAPYLPVDRLMTEEVRRRGDARRRRRLAVQGPASTLAVAAVVGAVALGIGGTDGGTQEPTVTSHGRSPSSTDFAAAKHDPVLSVPDGFPLAVGYPEVTYPEQQLTGPNRAVEAFTDLAPCDNPLQQTSEPVDQLSVTFSQPEDGRSRALTVYNSTVAATAQLDAIASLYRQCPRQSYPDGSPDTVTEVHIASLGDQAVSIVRRSESNGTHVPGIDVVVAVRVGNAVLLTSQSNEGGSSPASVRQARQSTVQRATQVVASMCVFADDGCPRD